MKKKSYIKAFLKKYFKVHNGTCGDHVGFVFPT